MEPILHIAGLCGDTHTHLDLMDLLLGGTTFGMGVMYVKCYFNTILHIVKEYLKPKN